MTEFAKFTKLIISGSINLSTLNYRLDGARIDRLEKHSLKRKRPVLPAHTHGVAWTRAGHIDLEGGEDRPARSFLAVEWGFRAVPRGSTLPATTLTYGVPLAPASRPLALFHRSFFSLCSASSTTSVLHFSSHLSLPTIFTKIGFPFAILVTFSSNQFPPLLFATVFRVAFYLLPVRYTVTQHLFVSIVSRRRHRRGFYFHSSFRFSIFDRPGLRLLDSWTLLSAMTDRSLSEVDFWHFIEYREL